MRIPSLGGARDRAVNWNGGGGHRPLGPTISAIGILNTMKGSASAYKVFGRYLEASQVG